MSEVKSYESIHNILTAWHKTGGANEAIFGLLSMGSLDVWLDPLLPTYALGDPAYLEATLAGALTAGRKVVEGEYKYNRYLLRSSDSFTFLRSCLQPAWEKVSCLASREQSVEIDTELAERLLCLHPWGAPYPSEDGSLRCEPVAINKTVLLSPSFREYTRWCVALLRLTDLRPDDRLAEQIKRLDAWASSDSRTVKEHMEAMALQPKAHVMLAYASNPETFVYALSNSSALRHFQLRPTFLKVNEQILLRHPVCPLLPFIPAADEVQYEDYHLIPDPEMPR